MTIQYVNKDITTVTTGVVVHGVNCQGAMGRGVAKAIKETWPIIYDTFKNNGKGKELLGQAHVINIDKDLFVVNAYTQEFYGSTGRFADPISIEIALKYTYLFADAHMLNVYMPKIGCGFGGLDWETEVEPIINTLDDKYNLNTYVCSIEKDKL